MEKENISSAKKVLSSIDDNFETLKDAMRSLDKEGFEKAKNQISEDLKKIEGMMK